MVEETQVIRLAAIGESSQHGKMIRCPSGRSSGGRGRRGGLAVGKVAGELGEVAVGGEKKTKEGRGGMSSLPPTGEE